MEAMSALYLAFLIITVLIMGIVYFIGRKKFGIGSDYLVSLLTSIKTYLRIISILALISLLLINSGRIPPNSIPFLCIPFFIVNTGVFGAYFRLSSHYAKIKRKK